MYHRRCNALSSIMPYTKCKAILNVKSEPLGSEGYLFKKEFRKYVTGNRRAKNQTMAILKPTKK